MTTKNHMFFCCRFYTISWTCSWIDFSRFRGEGVSPVPTPPAAFTPGAKALGHPHTTPTPRMTRTPSPQANTNTSIHLACRQVSLLSSIPEACADERRPPSTDSNFFARLLYSMYEMSDLVSACCRELLEMKSLPVHAILPMVRAVRGRQGLHSLPAGPF